VKKVLFSFVVIALLALACGEEEGVTPTVPEHPVPTTPVNVLKNVAISFNQRDINLLKAMLGPNFVFYFDPRDVGQRPPGSQYRIPESWNRGEFIEAVNDLYKKAFRVSLSITTDNVGEPRPEETAYYVENVPVELLAMLDELNGFIAQSASTFEFERYLAEGGGKRWRLTEWQDRGGYYDEAPAAGEPSTIGRVLALFYAL
jgi:hypothetical protein